LATTATEELTHTISCNTYIPNVHRKYDEILEVNISSQRTYDLKKSIVLLWTFSVEKCVIAEIYVCIYTKDVLWYILKVKITVA
jgi:hypothetical protein